MPKSAADRSKWQAFAACVAVASLTILDLSKVNVGIPAIEQSLGADSSDVQLIVAGYALAFGLVLVPAGRYGDLHSRRRMFIIGLALFAVSSLLCSVAPEAWMLIAARLLQGVSAGILMPQVIGLIQQLFTGAERGRAFGLFGAVIGLATAFGPALGGLLIELGGQDFGWRLIFLVNVPLTAILLPIAMRLLPRTQPGTDAPGDLDPVGALLLGAATFTLMLPLVLTTGSPDDDPRRWAWLAVFAASAAAFVSWELRYARHGKTPIVDFRLFRVDGYLNGLLVATTFFAAMPATFLILTLYLQQGLGLAALYAGLVTAPFALASAVTSWYSGGFVHRVGRPLVVAGLAAVIVGFAATALVGIMLPQEWAPWAMAATMTVAGAGGGIVIAPNQTLTLEHVPVAHGGVAGSIIQVGQRVGTALGIASATAAFYATIFAEAGEEPQIMVFHDAFRNGTLVVVALLLVALGVGIADLRRRREKATSWARPR